MKSDRGLQIWIKPPLRDRLQNYAQQQGWPNEMAVHNLIDGALKQAGFGPEAADGKTIELREPVEAGSAN